MTEETYARLVEQIYERDLKERMIGSLKRIGDALTDEGFKCSQPYDFTDTSFAWAMVAERGDLPEPIDIRVEIAESLQYEGTTEGINIGMDIVGYDGRIIGQFHPYNYSPDVWVPLDDLTEISERMRMLEDSDIENIPELIEKAYDA